MTSSGFSREADAVTLAAIAGGKTWTATSIRNPFFRKHCRELNKTMICLPPKSPVHLRGACSRLFQVVALHSDLLHVAHPLVDDIVPALIRVARYARFWIREPECWDCAAEVPPDEQWSGLLRHLFAEYSVPRFFDSAWRVAGRAKYLERDWFCHIARGGSWRKAEHMPPSITAKALHHAMSAPGDLTVRQALRWGQLSAIGGSQELVEQVLASPMVRDLSNDATWSRLFVKLEAAREFDPREFGVIADLLLELQRQDEWKRAALLVAEPLASLRSHCYRRWRELQRMAAEEGVHFRDSDLFRQGLRTDLLNVARASWNPMPDVMPFELRSRGHSSRWTIRERLTQAQLLREGRLLRHCVGWYWRRCKAGRSAIFSLAEWREVEAGEKEFPRVTIEVDKASRRIVQIRARWNNRARVVEQELIAKWAAANGLGIAV
ncbi:PcfJ domain-containing protein [Luteolibacter sp. Populi]|uniref:PcfJ domain-containing protein n=1 Tax=Luteolibacter sp. Populi TaxID=3230487 RepID=UPI00346608A1